MRSRIEQTPESALSWRQLLRSGVPALAGAIGALYGCGSGSATPGTGNSVISTDGVRALNAYVSLPGGDGSLSFTVAGISLSGSGAAPAPTTIASGTYTQRYSVPVGSVSCSAFSANTQPITGTFVLQTTTPYFSNLTYTLAAAGKAGQTGEYRPTLFMIPEVAENIVPGGDFVAIRMVNLSPGLRNFGLFNAADGMPTTSWPAPRDVVSATYGFSPGRNAFYAGPTPQHGSFALVDLADPLTAVSLDPTSNLNTVYFRAGFSYTLFIVGESGNSAFPLAAFWTLSPALSY